MDGGPFETLSEFTRVLTENGTEGRRLCVLRAEAMCREAGIPTSVIGRDSARPVLYARLRSKTPRLSPLLLYTDVSVSEVSDDPLGDALREGRVRALSPEGVKSGAALFLSVVTRMRQDRIQVPYDIILLISCGSLKNVTVRYPRLFKDVRYALSDNGGFPVIIGHKKMYPVTVAENQFARLRVTAHSGRKPASAKIAAAITRLYRRKLPVKQSDPVRLMAEAMGKALGEIDEILMSLIFKPFANRAALKLLGGEGALFAALTRNEVSVNIIRGGANIGKQPEMVFFDAQVRLVPGATIGDCVSDIRRVIRHCCDIDVVSFDPPCRELDMTLFAGISGAIVKRDLEAAPVPFVTSQPTDGRFLAEMGIQSYGFAPVNLPANADVANKSKSALRQAREDALNFGETVLLQFLLNREE